MKISFIAILLFVFSFPTEVNAKFMSCNIDVEQKYVDLGELRDNLSRLYIKKHYDLEVKSLNIDPRIIVIHWTAIDELEASFKVFKKATLPASRKELNGAGQLNVGAHFLVAQNGKIFQLLPLPYFGRHVIGLNYYALGIENVGGRNSRLTNAQLLANEQLVRCLVKEYPKIKFLSGHHEYRTFEGTELFLEKNSNYRTNKSDPGDEFMNLLRGNVQDLYESKKLNKLTFN